MRGRPNNVTMWVYDVPLDGLREHILQSGMAPYTADQIFEWVYQKFEPTIDSWSNISKINRLALKEWLETGLLNVVEETRDSQGTKKFLIELDDGNRIESVLIPEKHHYTFCLSTQVGCPLGCAFCATGRMGFVRDLSAGEILVQILIMRRAIPEYCGKKNIVFMGMGEPLLNYSNLKNALEILTSQGGMAVSPRNITVSTAGIIANLQRFERDFPNVKISVSLNAPNGDIRQRLMPVTNRNGLEDLIRYLRGKRRRHRITFEYVLLAGINDGPAAVSQIAEMLRGIPCKINIIPYNKTDGNDFCAPDAEVIGAFSDLLHQKGYTVMVRWSKGSGIRSACGQLATDRSGR